MPRQSDEQRGGRPRGFGNEAMTDIVERLRAQIRPHMFDERIAAGLIGEAADEIERLRAALGEKP